MAKKVQLAADVIARLKAVGIKATTEDVAREKLLEALKKIGVEGMETENTNSLLDMVEGFGDDDEVEEEEEEVEEEEESEEEAENDALAAEVAEEAENNAEEESEEEDDEEEEEEDEKPAPAKKATTKKVAPAAKKSAKKTESTARKSSVLKPKTNDEDKAVFDELQDIFPTDDFAYDYIQSGVTIKNKGANSKRGVVALSECKRTTEGTVMCNLYFLTMGKKLEVLEENDIEYSINWSGAPYVKGVTVAESKEIIGKVLDDIVTMVKKIDDKLGKNREKMMKDLKKNKTAAKPKAVDEEEDASVAEESKTESKKATAAKKVAKKKK